METSISDEKVDLALRRLSSRFSRIISKLNDEDLALLAYVMNPRSITPYWSRAAIEEGLFETANNRLSDNIMNDNGRYMLVHIGDDIYKGKL